MTARIIDGKKVAAEVEQEVRLAVADLAARGVVPGLSVIRVGDDPASEIYVANKEKKAVELGIAGRQHHLPTSISQNELARRIDELNRDDSVDGILLQLPIPGHLNPEPLIQAIDPFKDVDGFHPVNVGKLQLGYSCFVPCTPAGILRLIESTGLAIQGKDAVVVGRSNIVGKPVAALLLRESATVTICHSKTTDLAAVIRHADIVIAAVGKPLMIQGEMIKPGAIVIDVGINRVEKGDPVARLLDDSKRQKLESRGSLIVGDVDFHRARAAAGWITPVPGGVGPMTIAMLMKNTVQAAAERRK